MIVIGIEGKAGSGKSTLCKYLTSKYPIEYIEVDKIIHNSELIRLRNIILTGATVLAKTAVSRNGGYKRKIKGENDRIKNKIKTPPISKVVIYFFYKAISKKIKVQLEEYKSRGKPMVIVDYALLNVSSMWDDFDYRVCVSRDEQERRRAIKKRDGKNDNQVDFISLFAKFDIVKYDQGDVIHIHNNGDENDLKRKGDLLLKRILESVQKKTQSTHNEEDELSL